MKITGITRRIDDLGRIVIPKEIRKNLHIKNGELLEVYLSTPNVISLKKYTVINENLHFINDFINILSKKLNCNIHVTNLDTVVFSTIKYVKNEKISDFLDNIDLNNENFNFVNLTKNYVINKPFLINKISPNGDLLGYIIFEFKSNANNNNDLIDFFVSFLNEYLESN